MNKFHEIEIQKIYDAILAIENFRVQVGIFFATVNLGALSIAVTKEKAIIILFSAILFWIMIPLDLTARATLAGHYYRVQVLHKKYVKRDSDYSPNKYSTLAAEMLRVINLPDGKDKTAELRKAPRKLLNRFGFWLPAIISLIEIIAGIVLWRFAGWTLI